MIPNSVLGDAQGQPVASAEAPAHFDIWEYRVEGNSVLEKGIIEKTVYPFLGPDKSIEEVERARAALQKVYQDAGYGTVLVDIPEQGVDTGVVALQVTEGTIERLKVTGSRYFVPSKIKEKVPSLAEGQVPHLPTVQKELIAVGGELADRAVTPVLRAGSTPGKLEAELQVKDELPLHGGVEINSRNAQNTTRTRLASSLRYDNLWQAQHSAALQFQISPENPDEVEVWSGTYAMPTGIADSRLAFYAVGVSSNTVAASAGALNVIGDTNTYGLSFNLPLGSFGGFFHAASAGFQYRESGQSLNLIGGDTNNKPVDYGSFLLGYTLTHRGESRLSSLDLGLHLSFRGLANDPAEFAARRSGIQSGFQKPPTEPATEALCGAKNPTGQAGKPVCTGEVGASPNFVYLTGEFRHQEILPFDTRLLFRFGGQIADSMLISPEQFSAGGPTSVRGYHLTEALADSGLAGSVEFYSPKLYEHESIQEFRALTFFEGAKLWVIQPLQSSRHSYRLASFGAGLRIKAFQHYIGELDWGYPLYSINRTSAGEQRVDFRVAYEF